MATKGFTKIDNSIIFNSDLSLEALGLYIKLKHLSTIDNFSIRRDYIKSISGYGETAFRRVWKELKDKGVLIETKSRNKGRYEYTYEVKTNENKKAPAKSQKPVDSDGHAPVEGQVHIEDVIEPTDHEKVDQEPRTKEIMKVVDETGFNAEQSKELLKVANNDAVKVIQCYRYALSQKNVRNIFNYTIWAIKNNFKEGDVVINHKVSTFNNFSQRIYDFNKLERALLYGEEYQLPV